MAQKNFKRIKLGSKVIIFWWDSMSINDGWQTEEDLVNAENDIDCESTGFVVFNGTRCIGISSSITGESFHNCMLIPKCSITKIVKIKEA